MKKKSRKGKKRNVSKRQLYLETLAQCEGKMRQMNSIATVAPATQEWKSLTRACEMWRNRKFETAGKVMLAESKNGAHNG